MFSATTRLHLQLAGSPRQRVDDSLVQGVQYLRNHQSMGVRGQRFIAWTRPLYAGLVTAAVIALGSPARAEEPRSAKEPRPLLEPIELTQVPDAFDDGDPIDVNVSVGYQYSSRSADILRESATADGLNPRSNEKIAQYNESTHRLLMRADIGIFHDLALVVRLPVILNQSRGLGDYQGPSTPQQGLRGAANEQLFQLPFDAPNRHGIEYLALGVDWGVLNQYRDVSKPSWVVGLEGRFSVSEPMHACNDNPAAGQVKCAAPGDVNRNGRHDASLIDSTGQYPLESGGRSRQPGVSRGTTGMELHTYVSKRIKYIEPYGGFRALFEFPNASSDFGLTDLRGNLVNHPPLQGTFLIGTAIIPWEVRSEYQRLTFDLRLEATYRSEGRDYNELFDALGSSPASTIRMPNYSGYRTPAAGSTGTSAIDPNSERVYFSGLVDTQQYIITRYAFGVTYQLNQYIKFGVGTAVNHVQSHFLTFEQPCNASLNGNLQEAGPCRGRAALGGSWQSTGIPNPNYRAVINAPGRRFLVDGSTGFDGWLSATAMF
jgi:hypothetical protein